MVVLGPEHPSALDLWLVLVVFVFVEGFAVVGSGILRAELRDTHYLLFSILRFVLTATIGAVGAVVAGVIGALMGLAVGGLGFAVWVIVRWVRAREWGSPSTRRRLATYGLPLMATTVCMWSLAVSDRLFLAREVTPHALGDYAANYRLGSVVMVFLAGPMVLAWMPRVMPAPWAQRRALFRRWLVGFAGTAALASLLLVALAPELIEVIFGPAIGPDRTVVALVAASGILGGLYYLLATPLLVSESTVLLATTALGVVAINLAANAVLINHFGAHGAAWATFLSYACLCALGAVVAWREGWGHSAGEPRD
jgi:O-antigen/teichoic acid export membrane protein